MAHKDGRYRLPAVIDPERICVQLYVPNDQNHLLAFWAQLEALGSALQWANDEDHTALLVAEVWREVYADARERYYAGGCGMDDPCCPDSVEQQTKTNVLLERLIALFESGFKIVPIDGMNTPPDLGAGECAPNIFDHQDGEDTPEEIEQREKALCITVERYIKAIMLGALRDMGAPDILVDYVASNILQDVPLSLTKIKIAYSPSFPGLSVFFAIASATLSFDALICLMVDALHGENNTYANFKASVPEVFEGFDAILAPLLGLVHATNQSKENYTVFNIALNNANNEDLSEYECPCAPPPPPDDCGETPLNIIQVPGSPESDGVVITNLGGNRWRFEQDNPSAANGGRYVINFQDELARNIRVEHDDEEQAVYYYEVYRNSGSGFCEGSNTSGSGGFTPVSCWAIGQQTTSPTNTVYVITCCVEPP